MVAPSRQRVTKGFSLYSVLARWWSKRVIRVVGLVSVVFATYIGPWSHSIDSYDVSTKSLAPLLIQADMSVQERLVLESIIGESSSTAHNEGIQSKEVNRDMIEADTKKGSSDVSFVNVVNEIDIAEDYSEQTVFNMTFFKSSPPCTAMLPDQVSFTLITQSSWDRMWIMKHHCERWPAPLPISISIYLPPDSIHNEVDVEQELSVNLGCVLSRMKVTIMKGTSTMEKYPVNLLRNLAIQAASTSHIIYTDSDFLISDGLYENLMGMASVVANDSKAAIVVPAFVYHSGCAGGFSTENSDSLQCLAEEWEHAVPKTKDDLMALWNISKSTMPNAKPGFHGIHFHSTTLYSEWKNQTVPVPIPCIKHSLYEPYLAVRLCNGLPEFPRIFRGYGWNKNIWCLTLLSKQAYKLWQLPKGFVFHLPHKQSVSRQIFKNATAKNDNQEHDRFLAWHKKLPKHPERMKACPDAKSAGNGPLKKKENYNKK